MNAFTVTYVYHTRDGLRTVDVSNDTSLGTGSWALLALETGATHMDWDVRVPVLDPVLLCCGQHASLHEGAICPDGLVMCCLCFERFPIAQLNITPNGKVEDVCENCALMEANGVLF